MNQKSQSPVLERAFHQLKKIYSEEPLEGGLLRKVGLKKQWNVIIGTGGQCGLTLNFTGAHDVYDENKKQKNIERIRSFIGRPLFDIAEETIASGSLQERSIGLACLNALSQPLRTDEMLVKRGFPARYRALDQLVRKDDVVAIVGHGGVVRGFFGKCREVHVTDMRPVEQFQTTVIGDTITTGPEALRLHTADGNETVLSAADFVMITGSTLVNDTLDELMDYCKKARVRALYGPSAHLAPEILYDLGVNMIQLSVITDPARFEFDMINDMDMEAALKANQTMGHEFLDLSEG